MQHTLDNTRSHMVEALSPSAASQADNSLSNTSPLRRVDASTTSFVDLHPMPAAIVNATLMVQHGNEQFRTLFTDAYLKQPDITLAAALGLPPDDSLSDAIQRALETNQLQRCTVGILDRESNQVAADLHCVPVQLTVDERGCMCFIHLSQQIRQVAVEDQVLSEFKSRLYAMIVHDFRTPLFAIRTAASTLGLFFDKLEKRRRDALIKTIEQSVDDLAGFLTDIEMINTARSVGLQLKYEMVDAPELCATIVREMQAFCNDSHVFSFTAPDGLVRLKADKRLLSRAIRNLLTNAIKFSPKNSPIRLEVIQSEQEVLFRVQDQGIGIPLNDRTRVFDTFYRAKNAGAVGGSGLGLALVKYAVLQQGGSIDVESSEGKGTTITLHFPK
jgi:signal transduction histidine kinase